MVVSFTLQQINTGRAKLHKSQPDIVEVNNAQIKSVSNQLINVLFNIELRLLLLTTLTLAVIPQPDTDRDTQLRLKGELNVNHL